MDTLRYLAYGSNLHPGRLAARVGAIEVVASVRLDGWALGFGKRGADGSGKCNIAPAAGGAAWAVAYDIPAASRATLDDIEGVGRGYATAWLELPVLGRCYVYLAEDGYLDRVAPPWDWYHALVVAGARQHGLPDAYLAALEAVASARDPDRARAERNLAVLDGA